MPRSRVAAVAMWMILAFPAVALSAAPEIFLGEEPETYLIIDKLEGMGYLPGLMTGDRGLEAREVAREADKIDGTGDPFADGMLRFLQLGAAPRYDFRLRVGLEHSNDGRVPPNGQGFPIPEGGGVRAGGYFRASSADWFSFQGRGDILAGFSSDDTGRIEETSVRLGWPQATLEAGRFSVWWGPGRHGSLLFTTNAEPLIGVRIRNPRPIPLGWWFRLLGALQYDFFLARLESVRPIPQSILSGARLAVKPAPWLEIGASRAMHFGGEGRDQSLSTFFDIFTGQRETEGGTPVGNSLASIDAKVRLPFRRQPVVLYGEAGGEDQSRPGFPTRWAFLGGLFLPSIGGQKKADLRIEYGTTMTNAPGVWYRHGQYPHQYRGQILGHHMGTDARDLFIEAHYFLLPSSYLEANLDVTEREFPGPEKERVWRLSGAVVAWLTKNWRAEGRVAFEEGKNRGGAAGADSTDASFQLHLAYQYR